MAKLVDVYRMEDQPILDSKQLPLIIDEGLTFLQMVMDLSGMGLVRENPIVKGKDLEEFLRKFNILTPPETRMAFEVTCKDFLEILSQAVPCVGCRRSVERLFYQLKNSGHRALDPLVVTREGLLSIRSDQLASPQILCALLHGHSASLINLVENQPRSKKSRRCNLHSLDSQRSRPISGAWREVWECMLPQCKDEVVLIDSGSLLTTLETYLRKHRFCGECRTKVLRAYTLLVEEPEPCKEKGYIPALYSGIKRCLPEKHIHLQPKTDYIGHLISRAETELLGRERHAKTMEIAQEEVLTCLGLCVYERLHRIHLRLREEESTCQVLAAVAIEALCRNFEVLVERKQGVSQLELLYQQITKEELAKQQRKEQKKQKRKKKKERRVELEMEEKENNCECESEENVDQNEDELYNPCTCPEANSERHKLQVLDRKSKGSLTCYCKDCQRRKREGGSGTGTEGVHANQTNKVQPSDKKPSRKQMATNNTPSANIHHRHSRNGSPHHLSPCQSCKNSQCLMENGHWSSSEHSQDCGYVSETHNGCCGTVSAASSLTSSPEGSLVACFEGLCNHEGDCVGVKVEGNHIFIKAQHKNCGAFNVKTNRGPTLTLQQMLEEFCSSDEEDSFIPAEEVQEFKSRMPLVMEKRQELRLTLKKRFDQLCVKPSQPHIASLSN